MTRAGRRAGLAVVGVLLIASVAAAARLVVSLPAGLSPADSARLRQLAERATVAGRVDGAPFRLPAGVFEFLLDHTEFATQVTHVLKVGDYRVWREPDGMWLDDGGGAVGRFSIVYAGNGSRVVHLRGRYTTRYLPDIHGEALAVLEYSVRPAADARMLITPTLTGFVRIDSVFVETLSRLMSGTARKKAERLARRVVGDFAETAQKIEADPARVLELLSRRPGVSRHELEEFERLLRRTSAS